MEKDSLKPGAIFESRWGFGPDVLIIKVTARRVTFKPVGHPRALAGSMKRDGFLTGYQRKDS